MTRESTDMTFLLLVRPEQLGEVGKGRAVPVHMAYRMGPGPHLFRMNGPSPMGGGYLYLDGRPYDGLGRMGPFCQEVVSECVARRFRGIVCDFEGGRIPPLEQLVQELGRQCEGRKWDLLVPETYGHCAPRARVMISTALSGGSLLQRLRESQERFGRDRVVLALERVAEDFSLPSPTGSGVALTQEELHQRMEELQPSVFFSQELCARYFTYMSRESGAHFVLFDDQATLARKLELARSLGITTALGTPSELSYFLERK